MAKFCGQCGSLLNATALFCGGCGAKVPVAAAAARAPNPPRAPDSGAVQHLSAAAGGIHAGGFRFYAGRFILERGVAVRG